MIEIKRGKILQQLYARPGIECYLISVEDREEKCISYPDMIGPLNTGDEVLVNTSAVSLSLGTGGYHFVISNLHSEKQSMTPGGHIMKLRYTPMQVKVLSVEEEDSPHHNLMVESDNLEKTPVIVTTLHSMLAPLCIKLHEYRLKVAYVMTDGAALPISFSHSVYWLKTQGMLEGTVTIGHAFGGDLEAVNIYSGLLAAQKIIKPDVIIVGMGPGIVGTGTKWGFTGIEQGDILNAVEVLNGTPVAVPRISFADRRKRHYGISHHTLTVLSRVCRVRAVVPLPVMDEEKTEYILGQIMAAQIADRYQFCMEDSSSVIELLKKSPFKITTMGRGVEEETEFFRTLGAAAIAAKRLLRKEKLRWISLV